jgi:site-specific DNA-methyltransferase (adenine-specific)
VEGVRPRRPIDLMNKLFFGDNLNILREHIADESVDLIYYSVLFKTPKGHESDAQITAFEDSWHWGEQAQREFTELEHCGNTDVTEMMLALRKFLKENDMMAYLTMMANRLLELRRVLKPTGSLYLHCDPTASHYLKIVLDAVFSVESFTNEIVWKRTTPKGLAFTKFSANQDTILFYRKSESYTWNPQYAPYTDEYRDRYNLIDEKTGKRFQATSLLNPNPNRPNLTYEFHGHTKVWRWTKERMLEAEKNGLVYFPPKGGVPREKRFLEEQEGVPISSVWTDIPAINAVADERLGYPTQKPLALLERIIKASSNEGDVVLDPFCGCGTAVHAAQKLNRKWIGIDITHLAISLIEKRLKDAFPGINFEVEGTPKDIGGARDLAERHKYQFQWWATSLVGAQPYQGKKKGADSGIDGLIFFHDDKSGAKKIVVSVKGGENVSVAMIRDFAHVIEREKAAMGFFVTLAEPTGPMTKEAVSFGYYDQERFGPEYPKMQILTIEGLMNGTQRPIYPDLSLGRATFKRAQVEDVSGEQGRLL